MSPIHDDSDAIALMRAAGEPADHQLPKPIIAIAIITAATIGSTAACAIAGIMVKNQRRRRV